MTSDRTDAAPAARTPVPPQPAPPGRRLAEILGGLALASDVANGFPDGKAIRTALLAALLLQRSAAAERDARNAYFVTLLRFTGCTAFAHEEASRYGAGDDTGVRNAMALADVADRVGTFAMIARGVARGAPLAVRAAAIGRLVGDGRAMTEHAHAQCDASVHVATAFGVGDDLQSALRFVCERYDGKGAPTGAAADALPLAVRALHVADVLEIGHHRGGRDAALALLRRRRGRQLDPALVDVALGCARELFDAIESADVWERFLEAEPQPQVCAEAARLDEIAAAIGRFGDVKSVHTLGHSAGVAAVATAAARELGLRDPELSLLRQCAHLHDLGRVGIENRIWDKRGELNRLERERVELHAVYTDRLLSRAPTWAACAQVAAAAHERFDGSGYPRRVPGPALPRLARLLAAADMAQAMREARPHRPARSPQEIAQALHAERRRGRFESEVVDAVLAGLGIGPKLPPAPHHALSEREIEVLGLVARGKTNREIAQLLGISPRTVQNHVAHVYDKIGVYSRAGAALYVMQKGLVGFG